MSKVTNNEEQEPLNCLRQISGVDENNKYILAVVVKRTYNIEKNGSCTLCSDQIPLSPEQVGYAHNNQLLESECELFPYKKYADLVVKGRARNYSGTDKFISEIIAGGRSFKMLVSGNQRPYLDNFGKIKFTEIDIVDEVPLRFDYAYGGADKEAEKKIEIPPAEYLTATDPSIDLLNTSIYRYPCNPAGKGYIVELSGEAINNAELPNLQDPDHPITPSNIIVGNPKNWVNMPLPYAADWVSPVWFPRMAYLGLLDFSDYQFGKLKEFLQNWVEEDVFENKPLGQGFNFRFCNGAHYGLQFERRSIPADIKLISIHPVARDFLIKLPQETPRIWVDGRNGKLLETNPVINSIVVEPDENRLTLVWSGIGKALRPYLEHELKIMPFKVEF